MTGNEIRSKFLTYFQSKAHTIVKSDSLVPKEDPTVLFTTAGMQQFKRQFLGDIENYTRAATSQKCMRTDDLEEVGQTDFHHTFFEMLGNFSFGDYFKKEAINWGWEFLTKELDISADRLWVSVNKDDTEARDIWLNDIGIPEKKIFLLGDKSNFWPSNAREAGPNGPCGPCSEIFYDYDPDDQTVPKDPDDIPGRFSEVWNLVFTQSERKEGGQLDPLPNKNIDTGMGLERLCAVIQGKKNNFETDLFTSILKRIDRIVGANISLKQKRIIADHIRAITFGINDGVVPSNEGRGYVIKKLIIIISDIAQSLGLTEPCIYKLVPSVLEAMEQPYPELKKTADNVSQVIKGIEEAYISVRAQRIPELAQEALKIKKESHPDTDLAQRLGELIFKYRDTYGLTLDTIDNVIKRNPVDISGEILKIAYERFNALLKEQQDRARASSKMTGDVFTDAEIDLNVPKTVFMGYKHSRTTNTILKIFIGNEMTNEVKLGDEVKIILDKTPFYAESGGQAGDTGCIRTESGVARITDTKKVADVFIHIGFIEEGIMKRNEQVHAEIDIDRRLSIMRHHTATHLLQTALRAVLGSHVQQQGSYVDADRLRFDFTHPKALNQDEIIKVEDYVNRLVLACDTVTKEYLSIEEAQHTGALAFFAEKYGDVVRVVSVGDYSKEFCGGTHLDITGQIGLFKIVQESAIAQGIRRIEAKTGYSALSLVHEKQNTLESLSKLLKVPETEILDRIKVQSKKIKQLQKDIEQYRFMAIKDDVAQVIEQAAQLKGFNLITAYFKDVDMALLRRISDLIRRKVQDSIIVLGGSTDENASLLIAVTDSLVERGIKANELINLIAPIMNGKGGGRPQLAQAGSKEITKIETAIKQSNQIIKEKVSL
ncbi:MAG: alanine--tRNA ligase [Candidatus Omnitrophica bacterium]|nr:alanine--tRNA ligase [Candidatus Omnitrophota bacterium]